VNANSSNRTEVTQICNVFRGKIIDVSKESLVIEATGNENKIVAFLELIEPFGIIELARTGTVSLRRGRSDH
jgi:acetolactate synthase-1/3 small subunit